MYMCIGESNVSQDAPHQKRYSMPFPFSIRYLYQSTPQTKYTDDPLPYLKKKFLSNIIHRLNYPFLFDFHKSNISLFLI